MCDLTTDANTVTSVSWNERGNLVAVGTHHGYVMVWDVAASKQVRGIYIYFSFKRRVSFFIQKREERIVFIID